MTYHTHQTRPRGGREREREMSQVLGSPFSVPLWLVYTPIHFIHSLIYEKENWTGTGGGGLIIGMYTRHIPSTWRARLCIGKGKGLARRVSEDIGMRTGWESRGWGWVVNGDRGWYCPLEELRTYIGDQNQSKVLFKEKRERGRWMPVTAALPACLLPLTPFESLSWRPAYLHT